MIDKKYTKPYLLHFSDVTELIGFKGFGIQTSFTTATDPNVESILLHQVVGIQISVEPNVLLADFSCETDARTFRDMCAMAAK